MVASCAFLDAPPECSDVQTPSIEAGRAGHALRFCGTGRGDVDRVKFVVDDPRTSTSSPAIDVGNDDFTIEWWMRAASADNRAGPVTCGANLDWINGNIVLDRDRYGQGRKYGVSLAGGRIVFGVSGEGNDHRTICGATVVADGGWHHIAVQRRRPDGHLELYVDGRLDAEGSGPRGDVSYPDDGVPLSYCNGLCLDSDPFLVLGAEKHDVGSDYPSYSGWLDELRVSTTLRYSGDFTPPIGAFEVDDLTAGLWHFDEGSGHVLTDSSPHGGHGLIHRGGPHDAPRWGVSTAPLR